MRRFRSGEILKQREDFISIFYMAAGNFSDDERMAHHASILEEPAKLRVVIAQMIYPNGSID